MASKIIFNVSNKECSFLLLEENQIAEYHKEKIDQEFGVGDIYVGTVKKIIPSLNAAFVDIGHERDAFLHYSDMSPDIQTIQAYLENIKTAKELSPIGDREFLPQTDKNGEMSSVLKSGQKVLVQVAKEAISTKGPRLTTSLALAGRYLILLPFCNTVTLSKKIDNVKERKRLTRLISSIKPKNFGVIVRTVAKEKEVAALDQDLKALKRRWDDGCKKLLKTKGPCKLIGELSITTSILRDTFNEHFDQIVVDNKEAYEEIKEFVEQIYPEKGHIVNLYKGKQNVYRYFKLDHMLEALTGTVVTLQGGGYLIMEQTEAMYVIDVNTGNRVANSPNQEEITLQVNIAAAKEIARQLRLRDIGGIVVVDFVGLKEAKNRKKLYEVMKEEINKDRAKTEVLPLSRFCVMEITRERVRPAVVTQNKEICPTCYGDGKIQSSMEVVAQLESQVSLLIEKYKMRHLSLVVHPYLYAYLDRGVLSKKWRWFLRYWQWLDIQQDERLPIPDFRIYNKKRELIAQNPQLSSKMISPLLDKKK